MTVLARVAGGRRSGRTGALVEPKEELLEREQVAVVGEHDERVRHVAEHPLEVVALLARDRRLGLLIREEVVERWAIGWWYESWHRVCRIQMTVAHLRHKLARCQARAGE